MSQPIRTSSPMPPPSTLPDVLQQPLANQEPDDTSSLPTDARAQSVAARRLPFTEEPSALAAGNYSAVEYLGHTSSFFGITALAYDEEDSDQMAAAQLSPLTMNGEHASSPKRIRLSFDSKRTSRPSSSLVERLKAFSQMGAHHPLPSSEKASASSDSVLVETQNLPHKKATRSFAFFEESVEAQSDAQEMNDEESFFLDRAHHFMAASSNGASNNAENESPLMKKRSFTAHATNSSLASRRLSSLFQSSKSDIYPQALAKPPAPIPQAFDMFASREFVVDPVLTPSQCHLPAPPTPMHSHLKNRVIRSVFGKKVIAINDGWQIIRNERPFQIAAIRGLHGQHSQIYRLQPDQERLVEEMANESILIKVFLKDLILKEHMCVENQFVPNMLRQHDELLEAGLGVVRIFNKETVLHDGYFIVERLRPFHLPWDHTTPLLSFTPEQKKVLTELESFFLYAIRSSSEVPLDLGVRNFGLSENGDLILLDLMERSDSAYAFRLIAKKVLKDLSGNNPEVYEHFRSLTLAIDPTIHEQLRV